MIKMVAISVNQFINESTIIIPALIQIPQNTFPKFFCTFFSLLLYLTQKSSY